ncbi:MAG: sugar phosphate isomerase/epimerase family protein [Planctomycetota bacterium]
MAISISRRTCLVAGLALAGATTTRGAVASHSMTLGFGTYGMKSLTTESAIKAIAEIGFDSIEITVNSGWDADSSMLGKARRAGLASQIQASGLKLTSLMEHVPPTSEKLQRVALQRLRLAADVAHDLAADEPPLIQTVLGGGDFESTKQALVDRLGKWVELADATETVIAIKPHRGGAMSKPSQAVWLMNRLGDPARLRMVYDYSHYAFRDLDIESTVQAALPSTAHIAVKDAVKDTATGRVRFALPGESGTVDYKRIFGLFKAGGYRGDVSCEVSGQVWSQKNYDPIAAARRCYKNMAAAFESAGMTRPSLHGANKSR